MAASGCDIADVVIEGDALRWYEAAPGVFYGFCGVCGSTMFWRVDALPTWMSIAAGTLNQPSGLHTEAALWTDQAADYHRLDPSVPAFARDSQASS